MTSGRRPAGTSPAGRPPPHGFCDDEATRQLLRSRPPRQALTWAADRLGGPVVSARALRGGLSSAVHLLTVQDDGGQRRLAELLPAIHAAPLPPAGPIGAFAPHPQASYQPPGWARYPRMWERAAEISHGPPPRLPEVLVHRDYHAGNVLWRRGKVCGVVDWQAACTGPAVADVAHCRVDLLDLGTDAAERFTAVWQHASGTDFHPWADVVTIIGFLDDLRDDWGPERLLIEDMLGRAVAELGGTSR